MSKLEKMEKVRSKYIKKIESIQNDLKDPNCPDWVKTQLNKWLCVVLVGFYTWKKSSGKTLV